MDSTYASTVQKNVQLRPKPFKVGSSKKCSKMDIGDPFSKKQCKICLMDEQELQKLMSPCKCTGSLQYVHKHCFIEFFMVKFQKNQMNLQSKLKEEFKCEICHEKYNYFLQKKYKCGSLQYFKKQINDKKLLAIILLLIFILSLGSLILMAINILQQRKIQDSQDKNAQQIFYILTGLSGGFIFLGVLFLIKDFIIQKKMTVVIRDKQQNQIVLMNINNPAAKVSPTQIQDSQLRMHNL